MKKTLSIIIILFFLFSAFILVVLLICNSGYKLSHGSLIADNRADLYDGTFFTRDSSSVIFKKIAVDDVGLRVPYSGEWRIGTIGMSVYDVESSTEAEIPWIVRFGKPVHEGTYISREYFLFRKPKKDIEVLKTELAGGCSDQRPSEAIPFLEGVKHYLGGAKGCSVGFAFNVGDHTYYLYRMADIGREVPNIDEEMIKIIESVYIGEDPYDLTQPTVCPLAPLVLRYQNNQYGFNISLPQSWKGFTIVTGTWQGGLLDQPEERTEVKQGPYISVRHPLWTKEKPYQDIPILIFTHEEWKLIEQEKMSVSAAPIGPSELGRNKKYVFALPARYNYAYSKGYEEVDQILMSKSSFHAF